MLSHCGEETNGSGLVVARGRVLPPTAIAMANSPLIRYSRLQLSAFLQNAIDYLLASGRVETVSVVVAPETFQEFAVAVPSAPYYYGRPLNSPQEMPTHPEGIIRRTSQS